MGLIVAAIALTACATPAATPGSGNGAGWTEAADFPLDARTSPVVVWTGSEVLVVGGDTGAPCPPNADCAQGTGARDGAAFDPATNTWRELAGAPFGIPPSSAAFAGGTLFVQPWVSDDPGLLSYDVEADAWKEWETPDDVARTLVADGDRVVFVSGSDEQSVVPDLVLDTTTGEWSELPDDPIGRAFDRTITPTPDGLVLTAKELVASPGSEKPALALAALYDRETGAWTRLPDTGQIGGWQWTWTGTRLVDPQLGGADGGQVNNWGRTYPYGGIVTVPDGEWLPLPNAPGVGVGGWIDSAPGGGRFAVSGGFLYDDAQESWARIDPPAGAAQEPGPAVWADGRLIVVGGVDWSGMDGALDGKTWVYTPAS